MMTIEPNGVATLTLNREARHNAFDAEMVQTMIEQLNTLSADPQVKILVLQANGKTFCAGADLDWMRKNVNDSEALATMMYQLAHFPKPTLAVVQGPAYGGGIGLIACCKIAIVSTNARFCFSEVKLGIIPAVIGPYVIRAIGKRHALAYFLSAQPFDAQTAYTMGLCQGISTPENLLPTANQWLQSLLQGGPIALQSAEQFVNECPTLFGHEIIEKTADIIATLRASPEGQEGITAFLEKRKPSWMS